MNPKGKFPGNKFLNTSFTATKTERQNEYNKRNSTTEQTLLRHHIMLPPFCNRIFIVSRKGLYN